jgi:hypothetical protein
MSLTGPVEVEALPLQDHREVGGLLELHDEHPLADGVRDAGRYEDGVSDRRGQAVHGARDRLDVLAGHPFGQRRKVHLVPEPELDERIGRSNLHHHPGLGLAVGAVEVAPGELTIRVTVDRQALARVEQLHQEAELLPEPLNVVGSEIPLRVGGHGLAEAPAVRKARQAQGLRSEHCGGRSHPVLGNELVPMWDAPEPGDGLPAAVEPGDLVGLQDDRLHRPPPRPRY